MNADPQPCSHSFDLLSFVHSFNKLFTALLPDSLTQSDAVGGLAECVHDLVDRGGEGQLPALRHGEQAAKRAAVVVARLHLGHNLE